MSMWIFNHLISPICYHNNVSNNVKKPSQLFYNDGKALMELNNSTNVKRNKKSKTRLGNINGTMNFEHCANYGHYLYGLENKPVDYILSFSNEISADKIVLILRDPINNVSSLLKYKGVLLPLHKYAGLWNSYTRSLNRENVIVIYMINGLVIMNIEERLSKH